MTKQKVMIKVAMNNGKSRTKAMKIAVSTPGVLSAKLYGDSLNIIVITGVGVDTTNLTILLRKKVGFTEVISVQSIGNKEDAEEEQEEWKEITHYRNRNEQSSIGWTTPYHQNGYDYGTPQVYYAMPRQDHNQDHLCTIL
ncbi:Heavy metal-associated isoprenylated plant protein [Thalictrum thalictroides]|uniref:Heavy metal-associated isoprenylated plant protein n=1 Tax=Thalictrum thalictroides TaxID=46969 RepID=A0A7J6WZC5_THATH|nr:Heavy metal-associated isoprenylated plant protein [Thalictrum thalictroides]